MLGAQACFAIMSLATRLGSFTLPWTEIAAARFLVGALVAIVVAAVQGTSLRLTDRRSTWYRSVFGTCSALGTFYALGSPRIAIGDAVTLSATGPIFVALLSAPLLGESVSGRLGIAVFVSFLGVLAVVKPTLTAALPVALAATAGAFCYALAMIWLRRIGPNESGEAIVLHFSIIAAATMLALSIPVWRTPDRRSAWYLVVTGVMGGLGQVAMTRAYALERALRLSALGYLGIVFTYVLAIPLFGERPGILQAIGALLVIAGGLLLRRTASRPA
jgi:drug/metabolite transporter (DMT)-like permease